MSLVTDYVIGKVLNFLQRVLMIIILVNKTYMWLSIYL